MIGQKVTIGVMGANMTTTTRRGFLRRAAAAAAGALAAFPAIIPQAAFGANERLTLANSIGESKALRDAVRRAGVVQQTGSCERARPSARFCCELVRNGYIGNLKTMVIHLPTDQGHHDNVRKLTWDPKTECFEGDDEANWLMTPVMRDPWTLGMA